MALCPDCNAAVNAVANSIRRDVDEKHRENRDDIRQNRDELISLKEEFSELRGRIEPYLDNGQPGLFSKMSNKIDTVLLEVQAMREERAEDDGRRGVFGDMGEWLKPLLVGLALIVAEHFWKH